LSLYLDKSKLGHKYGGFSDSWHPSLKIPGGRDESRENAAKLLREYFQ
jgi:hypothetical protein